MFQFKSEEGKLQAMNMQHTITKLGEKKNQTYLSYSKQ